MLLELEEKTRSKWLLQKNANANGVSPVDNRPKFNFVDGPPFATGTPHYGHLLTGTIKDTVCRYKQQNGFECRQNVGFDCHGVPVEHEVDKRLHIQSIADVEAMGMEFYNRSCRELVSASTKGWRDSMEKLGRNVDWTGRYQTMDTNFMESVVWAFNELYKKGLVYRSKKVMAYSTACRTPISHFEAGLNYREVIDTSLYVAFPLLQCRNPTSSWSVNPGDAIVIWTTTPWTLPSNVAIAVNPDLDYVKVGKYWLASNRLESMQTIFGKNAEIHAKCRGIQLAGLKYRLPFKEIAIKSSGVVIADTFVSGDNGTGAVHCAPAFGEDDADACSRHGVCSIDDAPCPVDRNGNFTDDIQVFAGLKVSEVNSQIITMLCKRKEIVIHSSDVQHSIPYCWRSDTRLIYMVVPSWFLKTSALTLRLLAENKMINWIPKAIGEKKFSNWVAGGQDWSISRSRFWGTPLLVWSSSDGSEIVTVGSLDELRKMSGVNVVDLHRENVDQLKIASRQGKGWLTRVPEVFDCWFESGCVPFAQMHYPFANKKEFSQQYPADFVAEGVDQCRGWFYSTLVINVALFDKAPFKNIICTGLILAEDGKKMSKRLKNYPDPDIIIRKHGADSLRLSLISSSVVHAECLKFREDLVKNVTKDLLLPWCNAHFFLKESETYPKMNSDGATNLTDEWIYSETIAFAQNIRKSMEIYDIQSVIPQIYKFVHRLTNVYIRLNRSRIKRCKIAWQHLRGILTMSRVIMSPFAPFTSDALHYEDELIHSCRYPDCQEDSDSSQRMRQIDRALKVIELGRTLRSGHDLPIRRPIKMMTIYSNDTDFVQLLKPYLLDEINVDCIATAQLSSSRMKKTGDPVWSRVGKVCGKQSGRVGQSIKALSEESLDLLCHTGEIHSEHGKITADMVSIRHIWCHDPLFPDTIGACANDMALSLDTTMSNELMDKWETRVVEATVQRLKKLSGIIPGQQIRYRVVENHKDIPIAESSDKFEECKFLRSETVVTPRNVSLNVMLYLVRDNSIIHSIGCNER